MVLSIHIVNRVTISEAFITLDLIKVQNIIQNTHIYSVKIESIAASE